MGGLKGWNESTVISPGGYGRGSKMATNRSWPGRTWSERTRFDFGDRERGRDGWQGMDRDMHGGYGRERDYGRDGDWGRERDPYGTGRERGYKMEMEKYTVRTKY